MRAELLLGGEAPDHGDSGRDASIVKILSARILTCYIARDE